MSDRPRLRKRKLAERSFEELEVDVTASEPLSRKAERRLKKRKSTQDDLGTPAATFKPSNLENETRGGEEVESSTKRSEYGIWIGNLPWTATKISIREFFQKNEAVHDQDITRIHLPTSKIPKTPDQVVKPKVQNKGFAYVDFATRGAVDAAIAMSEILMSGRRVLIKDARDFEGRPEASIGSSNARDAGKPPNRRVFIGNLDFEVTENELRSHFSKCGEISTALMATFEDSGKCKGYAWITFDDVGAAENAVKGWVEVRKGDDDKGSEKRGKVKRLWLHRMNGRKLRVEFAEGESVRYKKRYGKKNDIASKSEGGENESNVRSKPLPHEAPSTDIKKAQNSTRSKVKDSVRQQKAVAPSKPTVAQRLTGAMVESTGKKVVYGR